MKEKHDAINRTVRPVAVRPATAPAPLVLTPKDIISILRRHVFMIILSTILGVIVAGGLWAVMLKYNPKYTAVGLIKVYPPEEVDPMKIGGGVSNKEIIYEFRVSLATLIKQQGMLAELMERDKVRETRWFQRFRKDPFKAFDNLRHNLGAKAQRETEYIRLTMTCGDPEEAALIINEMMNLFIASRQNAATGGISAKLKELEEQRTRLEREVAIANNLLDDVRKTTNVTMLGTGVAEKHTITETLARLENDRTTLVSAIRQLQTAVEQLRQHTMGPINIQVKHQIETDNIMLALANRLALLEAEPARKLPKLGEDHRDVRETRETIKQIQEERNLRQLEIGEQTRVANLRDAEDRLAVLQNELDRLDTELEAQRARQKDLDIARAIYERRLSARDERKTQLDLVKAQIEKYRIMMQDPRTSKVQKMGDALPPLRVSSPNYKIYFPGGVMLGFLLGIGLAFLIELLNDTLRTPSDVSRHLSGTALLGIIPDAQEDEQLEGVDLCHVVRQAPYSIVSESYRQFRINLKLSRPAEALKTLLVTSGDAGDGKTSVAVNLTTTFIVEDKTVLFIDANFRRPATLTLFPKPAENGAQEPESNLGLSNLLTGQCAIDDVIRHSGIDGLDIIDSGPLPSNPAELLGSEKMKQLIQEQEQRYDYVIIDGPPVLLVSEAKILAAQVDAAILVVKAYVTKQGAAQRALRELTETNAKVAGCVLFGVKAMKGGYYHNRFRAYEEYQKVQLAHSI